MKSIFRKGFTLIELLIVIAIIAILAVAFLPTLLGSPAKSRDTARIADLQKIQKVLINADLTGGKGYPSTTGDITDALATGLAAPADTWKGAFEVDFGGKLPKDPTNGAIQYKYYKKGDPAIGNAYSFGLRAKMETKNAGNTPCTSALGAPADAAGAVIQAFNLTLTPPSNDRSCYVILVQ